MNRHDAMSAKEEPERRGDALAREVIGAAIEVHRHLRPGYLEGVYQDALEIEFRLRPIPFEREYPVCVPIRGTKSGKVFLISSPADYSLSS